jgi:hypothetical protein
MKGEKRRWEMSLILDIVEVLAQSRRTLAKIRGLLEEQKQQQGEKDG